MNSLSSINHRPTFQYSQPEAYRFSHDSVFLAQEVFDKVKMRLSENSRILDLCAGCGIVGMDFLFHSRAELSLMPECDFIEIQNEYDEHFQENVRRLAAPAGRLRYLQQNYSELLENAGDQYDLILCNPPYFRVGQGPVSPSDFKNRCRFFLDSDFSTLFRAVVHSLKTTGEAFILLRDLNDHGIDVFAEATQAIANNGRIEMLGSVRGTPLVRVTKIA